MKRKTIIIDGKPFTYNDESEDISYDTLKPITEDETMQDPYFRQRKNYLMNMACNFACVLSPLIGAALKQGSVAKQLVIVKQLR